MRHTPYSATFPSGLQDSPARSAAGNVVLADGAIQTASLSPSGQHRYTPIYLAEGPVDQLGVNITTAGGAEAVIRAGLYCADPYGGGPGALLADTGNMVANAIAVLAGTVSAVVPWSGIHWVSAVAVWTTTAPIISSVVDCYPFTSSGSTSGSSDAAYSENGITGALPAISGALPGFGVGSPRVAVRRA